MFDENSGQVFKEWTVPRLSVASGQLDWSRRRPYPLITARGTRGPRSLLDMATNAVANHVGEMSEDLLRQMPSPLLWRIWRFLEARGVCLHAWKLFSRLLLTHEDPKMDKTLGLYRFRQHICNPEGPLKRFIEPMTSLSIDFVSHLVISGGCDFDPSELLCLADMNNLAALEFIQPADDLRKVFPDITDRVVRGWAERDNPFPLLRVLRIWGIDCTSQDSLQWVTQFPSLVLYDVLGSKDDWRSANAYAKAGEWEHTEYKSGGENPLSDHLMLFAPPSALDSNSVNLRKSIESDLISLCSDSRCSLRFVPYQQAPVFLDYLSDAAKAYAPAWDTDMETLAALGCHGALFESWAFWLYSFIGQLSSDRDLAGLGTKPDTQAVVGPFVLPSKPMACLFLGHSGRGGISAKPSYVSRGLFKTRRYTFTRPALVYGEQRRGKWTQPVPQTRDVPVVEEAEPRPMLKNQKKRRLGELLKGFSG